MSKPLRGRAAAEAAAKAVFLMGVPYGMPQDGWLRRVSPLLHICHSKDYDLLTNSGNVISSNLHESRGASFFFCLRHKIWPKQPWHSEMLGKVGSFFSLMVPLSWKCSKSGSKKKSKKIESSEGDDLGQNIVHNLFFFFRRRIGR